MRTRIVVGIVILLLVAVTIYAATRPSGYPELVGKQVTLYKSMTCGCCSLYGDYLERNGLQVTVINTDDRSEMKAQQGVPSALASCHTMIIDGYFVEGHIPLEVVARLVNEKPAIRGIGMSGMPSGTPGMPGPKNEPWIAYAVSADGSITEYERI